MGISVITPPSKEWKPIALNQTLSGLTSLTINVTASLYKRLRLVLNCGKDVAALDGQDLITLQLNGSTFSNGYAWGQSGIRGDDVVLGQLNSGTGLWSIGNRARDPQDGTYWSITECIIYVDTSVISRYFFRSSNFMRQSSGAGLSEHCDYYGKCEASEAITSLVISVVGGTAFDSLSRASLYGSTIL